jgi:hypothetical protein
MTVKRTTSPMTRN